MLQERWAYRLDVDKTVSLQGCIFQIVLQTQVFRIGQVNEPCIGLTQENSIENSVQECLPYILNDKGPCYYFSSLPSKPCVCFKANMYKTCCYDIILLEQFIWLARTRAINGLDKKNVSLCYRK